MNICNAKVQQYVCPGRFPIPALPWAQVVSVFPCRLCEKLCGTSGTLRKHYSACHAGSPSVPPGHESNTATVAAQTVFGNCRTAYFAIIVSSLPQDYSKSVMSPSKWRAVDAALADSAIEQKVARTDLYSNARNLSPVLASTGIMRDISSLGISAKCAFQCAILPPLKTLEQLTTNGTVRLLNRGWAYAREASHSSLEKVRVRQDNSLTDYFRSERYPPETRTRYVRETVYVTLWAVRIFKSKTGEELELEEKHAAHKI